MSFEYSIRLAKESDLSGLKETLGRNGQYLNILVNGKTIFWLAETETSGIIGMTGAEISGDSALIRSTAVLAPYRGKGMAKKLVHALFDSLKERSIQKLYLFSRDTGTFWETFGFVECAVEEVITQVPDAHQVISYLKDNSIWTDVAWKAGI
jgi:N-acetylglutamate synthase-like GNAT family acetyltransferase